MRNNIRTTAFVLLCGSVLSLNAQNSHFVKSYGSSADEAAVDFIQTSSGDYYLLSTTSGYGAGGTDFLLTKTSGLGDILWSRAFGTTSDERATSLTLLSDGGVLITGITRSLSPNYEGSLVLKVTNQGVVSWTRAYSSDSTVLIHDAVQARSGDIYLTGAAWVDSIGMNTMISSLNTSGNIFWTKTYGGVNDDVGYSIVEDAANRLVVAGTTMNDSVVTGGSGDMDIQITRVTSSGNISWIKNYGTDSMDVANTIRTRGGMYYLAGYTLQSNDNTENALVTAIDTSGNVVYARGMGSVGDDRATGLHAESNGDVQVSATVTGLSSPGDLAVMTISSTGQLNSSYFFGGDSLESGRMVISSSIESGYSLIGSGASFRDSSVQSLYLIKTENFFSASCGIKLEILVENFINFSNNSHQYQVNKTIGTSGNLVTTTVSGSGVTHCCALEARVAGDTITICEGDKVRLGASGVSGYKYSWSSPSSSYSSANANPQVAPLSDIGYKLVVTDSFGNCTADSATVYVKVLPRLSGIDFVRDSFYCAGEDVTISAYPGLNSYLWFGDGYTYSGRVQTFDMEDSVLLTVIDNNSCVYNDTIFIDELELPEFNLGNDTTICSNLSITLEGPEEMATYVWNGSNTGSRFYTTSSQQFHTLEVTDSFGCMFEDEILVQTNPFATFDLGPDTFFCKNSFFTIFGPGALSGYIWNDTSSSLQNIDVYAAGTYHLTAYNSYDCPYSDTITIMEWELPEFSLGNDTGFCEGGSVFYQGPTGYESYEWSNGSEEDSLTIFTEGEHSLKVTDGNGCTWTDTVAVEEFLNPNISLGPDTVICLGESITLDPGAGYDTYVWSTGLGTQTITVDEKGTYAVTVTDQNGCSGSASVDVDTMTCQGGFVVLLGEEQLDIYPNPASSQIRIDFEGSLSGATIEMFDIYGRQVMSLENKEHHAVLDVSSLNPGHYVLGVRLDNNQIHTTVVVSRVY